MLPRIEYSVVVPVSVDLAVRAFCDLDRLPGRGVYDSVSWMEGKPWEVGSRIRYVLAQPSGSIVQAVVTGYDPPRFVAMVFHAFGITAEQRVTFSKTRKGSAVHLILDFVGSAPAADAGRQLLASNSRDGLDTMAALCRQWKAASSSA